MTISRGLLHWVSNIKICYIFVLYLFVCLYIYVLFNDAFSSSGYTVRNLSTASE